MKDKVFFYEIRIVTKVEILRITIMIKNIFILSFSCEIFPIFIYFCYIINSKKPNKKKETFKLAA